MLHPDAAAGNINYGATSEESDDDMFALEHVSLGLRHWTVGRPIHDKKASSTQEATDIAYNRSSNWLSSSLPYRRFGYAMSLVRLNTSGHLVSFVDT